MRIDGARDGEGGRRRLAQFERFMSGQQIGTGEGTDVVNRAKANEGASEPLDAVQVKKCWSAYIHFIAKNFSPSPSVTRSSAAVVAGEKTDWTKPSR